MAVVLVVALLALQRMHYFLMTNKGIYLALQGNYHDAEAQLDYVVTAQPENMRARRALAQVELDLGNYGVAQSIYHGLEKDVQKLVGEAICYYETDREDLAAEMLAQAREEAAAPLGVLVAHLGEREGPHCRRQRRSVRRTRVRSACDRRAR